jgi:enolase-phosphatase E1
VPPRLRAWHEDGFGLAVFSSGSVTIQEPWFRCNPTGDLASIMSAYFDTANAGPKRAASSYELIAGMLGELWQATADQLLFLSDVPAELDAAAAAGWQTIGVRRPGEPSAELNFGAHDVVASFGDVRVALPHSAGEPMEGAVR